MPAGLRMRNAANVVIFDTQSRAARLLGVVVSPSSGGSVTEPRLAEGTPWVIGYNFSTGIGVLRRHQLNSSSIGVSGTTVSWGSGFSGRILYGVR